MDQKISGMCYLGSMESSGRKYILALLLQLAVVAVILVVASVLDIIVSALQMRFYTLAVFVTIFGVAGIFATALGYSISLEKVGGKMEEPDWRLLLPMAAWGLVFFFLIAPLEGGEYETPFRAYGLMMALACLLFIKWKK